MNIFYLLVFLLVALCSLVIFGLLFVYRQVEVIREKMECLCSDYEENKKDVSDKLDSVNVAMNAIYTTDVMQGKDIDKIVSIINDSFKVFAVELEKKKGNKKKSKDISEEK